MREAAGRSRDIIDGATVGEIVAAATARYGERFGALLPTCRVWVNGEQANDATPVGPADEVAILPPVSGGATPT